MTAQKQVADLIVERLGAWGVKRIYGYAGDGNNPLLGALRRGAQAPSFIRAKHEEGAAFMAVGDAKYSGGVGVVTSTQGPGAVHLLNGLYDAKLDSVPVVALVGQQHRSTLGSDYQQEIDLQHLFHDVATHYVQLVTSSEQLPMVIDRAFRAALTHKQPTVVILPHDIQQAPVAELGQEHGEMVTSPRWTAGHTQAREDDLQAAADVINAGEKITILAGQGMKHAQSQVVQLAELLGAGITTSLLGKPYVDEEHPLAAGTMGHLGTTASAHILQECDTLIIIGSNDPWTEFYPPPGKARAVQIDIDASALANRYPVEVGLVGDSALTIEALLGRLHSQRTIGWRETVEQQVRKWREISRLRAEIPADPLNPELVVKEFAERISDNWRVAIDVGSSVYHYARQMSLPTSVEAHLSSTLASMGCAIPYGISAKESSPDTPVAVIAGDGAMQMLGVNELVTVAERWRRWQNPQFVVLVLHNFDLAEVSWEQREMESQPRFPGSQDIERFDFTGYAELLGLRGLRIQSPGDLPATLSEAFASDRPTVIEAITDAVTPLLPPFPHDKEKLQSIRTALTSEGAAGAHALDLLNAYVRVEEKHQWETPSP